ncbi:hypothetical protein PVAND_007082 [Polypedilum vanderplanki]|uniref:Uncharacterized protein n=1 Tax=Polypedilum vanderplanki TaxID=319348 RepID=A0A9J6C5A9_POLVA|nr:hypothetical protein PVAND_007082 [Polypedilum vanderplanki]
METRSLRSANINFHNYGSTQTQPINFYSEDFIAGFTGSANQISPVRRFFCLFVTFDLVFVGLLWLICVVITGENVYKALQEQILNYNIETSLFDVVIAAGIRFIVLIFFYGICKINHWFIIALTTTLSCGFLIGKVFYFIWPSQQPVFQVLLIIISFVISWFEAWFLDSRVFPQEQYSRTLTSVLSTSADSRTTLLPQYFNTFGVGRGSVIQGTESIRNFYSPVESDDEDEEFKHLGYETVQKAFDLLESTDWKVEKVTSCNDTISTCSRPIGKVYKLSGKVNYSPKKLLQELFYNIENIPTWNPTLLENRIIRKIDSCTDIAYSVSASGGGGIVKSRDFVNLRCWKLIKDSRIVENYNINSSLDKLSIKTHSSDGDNENSEDDEEKKDITEVKKSKKKVVKSSHEKPLKKSASDNEINESNADNNSFETKEQLSKSLGANTVTTDVRCTSDDDDESFSDAQDIKTEPTIVKNLQNYVFVSAAISIEYPLFPPNSKYIRGDNIISCWAMRHIPNESDSCIFEWLLCIDLKGSLPKVQELNEENNTQSA